MRSGEIDLNQNTQAKDQDAYVEALFGDRTEWASLFDWVDRFDLEEAIEATQGWEPIRSK
jgi:nucleoside-specific outer membrane channel protein Tsx